LNVSITQFINAHEKSTTIIGAIKISLLIKFCSKIFFNENKYFDIVGIEWLVERKEANGIRDLFLKS
jgi:hypothetical protein